LHINTLARLALLSPCLKQCVACLWPPKFLLADLLLLRCLQDEREALEALCFLSASGCQLEDQARLTCSPDSPQQLQLLQQHGQNSKGSSYTVEAATAPLQLSSGWLAAAGVRQPSPGSDVSSDGCQGALAGPEQQQQLAASLDEIHPGAHPVDIEHLAPASTQQQQVKARKGSKKQQQPLLGPTPQQQQQQQQQCNAAAFGPLASLPNSAVLAMQQAAAAGQHPQQAVHAPVAAMGLNQPLLPAQLASLLQAGNYDAAAAVAAGLSSAQPLAALQLQQQPQQPPGLSELLGLLSVGLPHAAVQQPQLPLLPMAPPAQQHAAPAQPMHLPVKRPPVKGCYWHVFIANMIAAGRKEQEAREQHQEPQQQLGRIAVTTAAEQQQGLAVPRKSSSPRLKDDAGEGGSPCKRQKRQESPAEQGQQPQQQPQQAAMPQLQLPPAAPLPNWLAAAGVLPPSVALAAAAAAATAAGQAGMLPQLLQAPALSGPLAAAAASMGLLGQQGLPALPLLGMSPAAALGGAPVGPAPELLLQLLSQQQQLGMDAAAVRAAPGLPAGFPLQAAGLLQAGGFPAGALLQALAAPGMGLVAQQ
jgi:hypothetical protein